jgi:hypothetical protein
VYVKVTVQVVPEQTGVGLVATTALAAVGVVATEINASSGATTNHDASDASDFLGTRERTRVMRKNDKRIAIGLHNLPEF